MSDRLYYVYGVVPGSLDVARAPTGVDDAPVAMLDEGRLGALVSVLDATAYGPNVDDRVGDVAWLGPKAASHDRVLTWASDSGPVVPLPILSLFRSEHAVRVMLDERREDLTALLDRVGRGREYGVRIFRIDDELRTQLAGFSPVIATLEAEVADSPSPGQGYLLSRKLDAAKKDEIHRVATVIANAAYDTLAARSIDAVQDSLPKAGPRQVGAAILNAAFFVAHDRVDDFRDAVTTFVRHHEKRGFRVEFTGPWPPYHFTRAAIHVE